MVTATEAVKNEEYEYAIQARLMRIYKMANCSHRYEALPSNYSLGANMLAGAFAGVAVSLPPTPSSPHHADR
jgi:hypothetical protein